MKSATAQGDLVAQDDDDLILSTKTFTVKSFGEQHGVDTIVATSLVKFFVIKGLAMEVGKAEKAPGTRGAAPTKYAARKSLGENLAEIFAYLKE